MGRDGSETGAARVLSAVAGSRGAASECVAAGRTRSVHGGLGSLGDAVLAATGALRVNYAIFGNLEPALHAHVHPRYTDEPDAMRTANPWGYDWSLAPLFEATTHGELRDRIRLGLQGGVRFETWQRLHQGASITWISRYRTWRARRPSTIGGCP